MWSTRGAEGTLNITNCSNTGEISGQYAGGICGHTAGKDSGSATIETCTNNGDISGDYAGGICGSAGFSAGSVTIDNCD